MASATLIHSHDRIERFGGLAAAILLHVIAIWGLLQFESVRRSIIEAAPIMVNFITPPPKVVEAPKPVVKRPAPAQKPAEPAPILSTRAPESPSPMSPPELPKTTPLPPIEPTPPAPPPKPAPVVPPSFGAAYLHNPAPVYPPLSKRMGEGGKVLLRVFVSAAGTADKIEIQTSSGSPRLDQAAQEAVRAWRFVPARQGDKAVPAWVIVPILFSLEG